MTAATVAAVPVPEIEELSVRPDGTVLRVVQVTDTHVPARADAPTVLGLLADIDAGDPMGHLELVLAQIAALHPAPELVVATGDLADTGDPAAYQRWRSAFLPLGLPVWVLPGNHDLTDAFDAHLVGDGVHAAVSSRHGPWEFLYVRTGNTEWGEIEPAHVEELQAALAASDAPNVFLWIHHPPVGQHLPAHETLVRDDLRSVLAHDDRVRAIAAGHVHVAADREFDGIPVYLTPSTYTGRPAPGYRTFELRPDGTVRTDVHFVDNLFSFDQDQITRLLAMAAQRYTSEPEARRGAATHARIEVERWRDAVAALATDGD
jgi:3',5'-cyclic-AMP phosphodiesterase